MELKQLDNCDLTFGDISRIKAAFVNLLTGYYHNRIKYQNQQDPDEAPAKTEEAPATEAPKAVAKEPAKPAVKEAPKAPAKEATATKATAEKKATAAAKTVKEKK